MKAFFAQVVRIAVIAQLESGGSVEVGSYPADTPVENIDFKWEETEKKHGKLKGIGTCKIYDTPSGKLEPGCLYWADWYPDGMYWDNQEGAHLMAVLPNGWVWDIDSRASNCALPDDRTHRCWCRHGQPPDITVDKVGNTCSAGAGSIQGGGWHGYLQNGEFKQC